MIRLSIVCWLQCIIQYYYYLAIETQYWVRGTELAWANNVCKLAGMHTKYVVRQEVYRSTLPFDWRLGAPAAAAADTAHSNIIYRVARVVPPLDCVWKPLDLGGRWVVKPSSPLRRVGGEHGACIHRVQIVYA